MSTHRGLLRTASDLQHQILCVVMAHVYLPLSFHMLMGQTVHVCHTLSALACAQANDFGGEIIPRAAADHKVVAYLFNDYWEDIGTIKSFFEANLALAQQVLWSG